MTPLSSLLALLAETFSGYGLYVISAFVFSNLLVFGLAWQHWQSFRQTRRQIQQAIASTQRDSL